MHRNGRHVLPRPQPISVQDRLINREPMRPERALVRLELQRGLPELRQLVLGDLLSCLTVQQVRDTCADQGSVRRSCLCLCGHGVLFLFSTVMLLDGQSTTLSSRRDNRLRVVLFRKIVLPRVVGRLLVFRVLLALQLC